MNGVIHVIDEVLIPPAYQPDIVDFLTSESKAEFFNILVDLVVQVNLTGALQSPGPFTLFAPTDAAFAQIGDFIDVNNATQVTDVLLYHVLSGIVLAEDIDDDSTATTLSGETLSFDKFRRHFHKHIITINDDSQVIFEDNLVTNGVIHVIDEVLIPPAYEPEPEKPYCAYFYHGHCWWY
uniref:FAS1 domain-containing protein n=1 Tax=Ditylum brightwellii TaxID=49249 RepID=A0A7S4QFW5_9STRA